MTTFSGGVVDSTDSHAMGGCRRRSWNCGRHRPAHLRSYVQHNVTADVFITAKLQATIAAFVLAGAGCLATAALLTNQARHRVLKVSLRALMRHRRVPTVAPFIDMNLRRRGQRRCA